MWKHFIKDSIGVERTGDQKGQNSTDWYQAKLGILVQETDVGKGIGGWENTKYIVSREQSVMWGLK